MLNKPRGAGATGFALALLLSLSLSGAQEAPKKAVEPAPAGAPAKATEPATAAVPPKAGASKYAGEEACAGCHDDIAKAFQKSAHAAIGGARATKEWEGQACEACHGPGAKHADSTDPADIQNPNKLRVQEADAVCLKCHALDDMHVNQAGAAHEKNGVSCVSCHSMHKGHEALRPRKFATINNLCGSCHLTVMAKFRGPYGHRLTQNAMSCVDCHSPHGALLPASINTALGNEEVCLKCHGNIRGPFVYQHAPVKLEGCTNCHVPHGTNNPKMLVRAQVQYVCLECHANFPPNFAGKTSNPTLGVIPSSIHNLGTAQFQNCTICHVKIHGSNLDRTFLR
jgi:DmsE family decaheme c-type cytochrome